MHADTREAHEVGRRARLEATFAQRDGRTVMTHGYAEPPLRIGRCLEEGTALHLILASSAPGLFGGDAMEHRVDIGREASVRLTSQSAQQVHPAPDGGVARAGGHYRVGAGARLSCRWDAVIPFPAASLDQQVEIDVEDGGQLVWSDALMAGREGRGERWLFNSLALRLAVRRGGRLAYLERYALKGGEQNREPWFAGGHCYFGTTLRMGFGDRAELAEEIHAELRAIGGVTGSADLLPDCDLLLVRIASEAGVPFHQGRAAVERAFAGRPRP